MRKLTAMPRKVAVAAVMIIGLTAGLLAAATPARAGKMSTATINGPATVLDEYACTWTASTDIVNPQYEWTLVNAYGGGVLGHDPYLTYAFDNAQGAHQVLELRITNSNGDEAVDDVLIGVYASGNPQCP